MEKMRASTPGEVCVPIRSVRVEMSIAEAIAVPVRVGLHVHLSKESTTTSNDLLTLQPQLERSSEAELLREMIGLTPERLWSKGWHEHSTNPCLGNRKTRAMVSPASSKPTNSNRPTVCWTNGPRQSPRSSRSHSPGAGGAKC